ncbi:MAG: hypothetical protein PVG65_05490 [Candidatus Thorarchaeota archaeon]
MEQQDIREFKFDTSIGSVKIRIIELENGLLIMFSDSDNYRLGFSAVAIPPGPSRREPSSASVFSTGLDSALSRSLTEKIAALTGQTCMIVLAMKNLNQHVIMEILNEIKAILVT